MPDVERYKSGAKLHGTKFADDVSKGTLIAQS